MASIYLFALCHRLVITIITVIRLIAAVFQLLVVSLFVVFLTIVLALFILFSMQVRLRSTILRPCPRGSRITRWQINSFEYNRTGSDKFDQPLELVSKAIP